MIDVVLYFIQKKLSDTIDENQIDVEHVSEISSGSTKLVMSVINVEEEATVKNFPASVRINGELKRKNPPKFLNIYVLFIASHSVYKTALDRLSKVITFFQNKRYFSSEDNDVDNDQIFPNNIEKITVEMYSLKLEELNHLWGILGGVYYPSVLYKVRVLRMEDNVKGEDEKEIKEIKMETNIL